MNPLTNMKNVLKLSERELESNSRSSWHDQYKDSAWIFVGGLPFDLSEGDIVCVFSQYGEIVNINLVRAKDTGKSKGFCFICYEDQRSTILAVDNLNGIKILNRTIRVDHVSEYKVPKEGKKTDEETKKIYNEGCAPKALPVVLKQEPQDVRETIADQIESDIKLPARLPIYLIKQEPAEQETALYETKKKKEKKKKKKKKSKRSASSSSNSESSEDEKLVKVKREHSPSTEKNKSKSGKVSSKRDKTTNEKRARSRSNDRDSKTSENTYRSKNDSFAYVPKRYRN